MFVFSFGEVNAAVLVIAPVCLLKSLKFGSALAHTHTHTLSLSLSAFMLSPPALLSPLRAVILLDPGTRPHVRNRSPLVRVGPEQDPNEALEIVRKCVRRVD